MCAALHPQCQEAQGRWRNDGGIEHVGLCRERARVSCLLPKKLSLPKRTRQCPKHTNPQEGKEACPKEKIEASRTSSKIQTARTELNSPRAVLFGQWPRLQRYFLLLRALGRAFEVRC